MTLPLPTNSSISTFPNCFARKMRKEMNSAVFTENIKAEVKKIYRSILKELSEFQDRYDDETNYSRNVDAQKKWNKKISEALQK